MELELDGFFFNPSEVNPFWLDPLFPVEIINRNL